MDQISMKVCLQEFLLGYSAEKAEGYLERRKRKDRGIGLDRRFYMHTPPHAYRHTHIHIKTKTELTLANQHESVINVSRDLRETNPV